MKLLDKLIIFLVALIALFSTSEIAIAQIIGNQTFTTTADFDGGNKGDPGTEFFVSNGIDQPMYSSITNPSAQYVNGRTYVVYQGGSGYLPYVTYYDHSAKTWATPVAAASSNPLISDGHGAPAMLVDSSGYIHVMYGSHSSPQKYAKSTNANDISQWTNMSDPTSSSTYPNLWEYNNSLYFLHREGTLTGDWRYRTSTNGGQSWSPPSVIIDMSPNGAYWGGAYEIKGDNFYFSFVLYNATAAYRHNVYVCYYNLATKTAFSLNGTNLGSFINLTEAESYCKVEHTGALKTWANVMRIDSSGNPYVIYNVQQSGNNEIMDVKFSYWNGTGWATPINITTTDSTSNYIDMIVNSSENIDAFITTGGIDHGKDVDNEYSGSLERWRWNGTSWSFQETIMSETKSGRPVNHPEVPLNFNPEIKLIFDQFGQLTTETNLKLYAWSSGGFVRNTARTSNNWGVETNTDNPTVPSGSFELSNGRGETFIYNSSNDTYKWTFKQSGDGNGNCSQPVFTSGVFNASVSNNGGTGRKACSIRANFGVVNDFEIRFWFNLTDEKDGAPGNLRTAICMLDLQSLNDTDCFGGNGVRYEFFTTPGNLFRAWNYTNGTETQIGSDTSAACNPCYFRLTRSGNTFTFFRSPNGTTWIQDEQTVSNHPTTLYPTISGWANGVSTGSWAIAIDDFHLVNGTLNADGYRKTGSWTTPKLSSNFSNNRIGKISITCENVSSAAYIDKVDILNSGSVVQTFDDNITSCSTVNLTATTGVLGNNRQVRITLAGNGSVSPRIDDVTVYFLEEEFAEDSTGFRKIITVSTSCLDVNKYVKRICVDIPSNYNDRINSESLVHQDIEDPIITAPVGSIYKYFKIDKVGINDIPISKATITFSVEKNWLEENNVPKDKIFLQKYMLESPSGAFLRVINSLFRITGLAPLQIGPWSKNDALIVSESDTLVNYESSFEDLSTFAITGEPETVITFPIEQPVQFDYTRIIAIIIIVLAAIILFGKFNPRR